MYLRTTKRKNKDGSVVEYHHLAQNVRDPKTKVSTPKIVHNFGRADELDRDALSRLCRSIARVAGLEVRDLSQSPLAESEAHLPDGLSFLGALPLGTNLVIETLWERLGIGPVLRKAAKADGCTVPYERALLAMTANRLCAPESKLGVWDRWLEKTYLPSCQGLKLAHMYEAMDLLHRHAEAIEEAVFFETANLLNLEVDVIFYDTTTASFAIDQADDEDDGLRQFGHSKEGTWTPQIVVALAVTKDGLPVRSWIFPGNTSDSTTVERVRKDLRGWKLGRALFVADSGMNSEENRRELARAAGKYVLATRMGSVKEVREEVLSQRGRYTVISENLHAKEVILGDGVGARRYILCYNPSEARRQKLHRETVVKELEEKLAEHPTHQATARWAMELKTSGRYGRYLRVTKAGQIRLDKAAVKAAARFDGKWVIQTNDDTLSMADAACSYRALMVIERCFRSLKRTQIKMMPMYHWLPRRIEAHVKICVLALLIERVAERACELPWSRIREELERLQAGRYETEKFYFFQRNKVENSVHNLLKKLDISLPQEVFGIESKIMAEK